MWLEVNNQNLEVPKQGKLNLKCCKQSNFRLRLKRLLLNSENCLNTAIEIWEVLFYRGKDNSLQFLYLMEIFPTISLPFPQRCATFPQISSSFPQEGTVGSSVFALLGIFLSKITARRKGKAYVKTCKVNQAQKLILSSSILSFTDRCNISQHWQPYPFSADNSATNLMNFSDLSWPDGSKQEADASRG